MADQQTVTQILRNLYRAATSVPPTPLSRAIVQSLQGVYSEPTSASEPAPPAEAPPAEPNARQVAEFAPPVSTPGRVKTVDVLQGTLNRVADTLNHAKATEGQIWDRVAAVIAQRDAAVAERDRLAAEFGRIQCMRDAAEDRVAAVIARRDTAVADLAVARGRIQELSHLNTVLQEQKTTFYTESLGAAPRVIQEVIDHTNAPKGTLLARVQWLENAYRIALNDHRVEALWDDFAQALGMAPKPTGLEVYARTREVASRLGIPHGFAPKGVRAVPLTGLAGENAPTADERERIVVAARGFGVSAISTRLFSWNAIAGAVESLRSYYDQSHLGNSKFVTLHSIVVDYVKVSFDTVGRYDEATMKRYATAGRALVDASGVVKL